jgi:NitT/TauT family transport system substrate-binding protein
VPTRRRLLAGAAACGALAGVPAIIRPARAAEPVTLITPFGFDSDFIDMMNAYSGGHLAREGLDAKLLGATGTVQSIQAVITGEAQFGRFSGIDFIRAVGAKGAPLRAVATLRQKSGFRIVSLPEKPIKSGADLKGKTIGLLSVGGTTQTFIEVLLAKNGIDKSEAKLIVSGNSPGEVELIHQGRLDCFICTFTVAFTLQQMTEKLEYFDVDVPVPAPGQVLHATRDTLTQKPDLVRKVLRAMKASSEEIMSQPIGPIFERAGKDFEIPGMKNIDNLVAQEKTLIADSWYGEGKENFMRNVPRRWQDGCDALQSVGFVDVKDPTVLYTNEFLDPL